jgi:hypothetical protein
MDAKSLEFIYRTLKGSRALAFVPTCNVKD